MSDDDETNGPRPPGLVPPEQPFRQINPLGPRVLVRVLPGEDRSPAGLFLPAGVKEKHAEALYGLVVEVARANARDVTAGDNVSGVPEGARVLMRKDAGVQVPWDTELRLVDVKDLLATVEELDPH